MPQEATAVAAAGAAAGIGWLTKLGLTAGAGVLGGCCLLTARHVSRVVAARRRLQELLADVAGEDARIVITGATSGIGQELARQFTRHPSVSLLLACRDIKKAEQLFSHVGERVRVSKVELLDLDNVQRFADEAHEFLRGGGPGLRLLVNNAGVMRPPAGVSRSNTDPTWQVNFFAPFLLTELLARRRTSDRASHLFRVVHVSSRLERRSQLTAETLQSVDRGQAGQSAYADSKRALMLWTSVRAQSLAFRASAFAHCATPGMVDTQLGRYALHPWLWPLTKPLRMFLLRSPAEGALGVAAAGLRPQAAETFGRYLDGEQQLEDLCLERMGEKQFAVELVKWATQVTALEARVAGYDR